MMSMTAWLRDPVVLICGAVFLVGLVSLLWALARLFRASGPSVQTDALAESLAGGEADELLKAPDNTFRDPLLSRPEVIRPAESSTSSVNRDVADRLETMAQRLAEMQNVLSRQASPAGLAAPSSGQGFSPETVDKLLKIIGNVVQQVDVLQRALNLPKEGAASGSAQAPKS